MRKINALLLALVSLVTLTWTSCTDTVDYTPAGGVEGAGVYFPTSVRTSYELEGEEGVTELEGTITLAVMRTDSVGALDAVLTTTFSEGGQEVFTVPSTVSFADGKNTSSMTIEYSHLKQGSDYDITLAFEEGTPYSNSTLKLNVFWPEEIVYTWEVVSENAMLTESLFSIFGMANVETTGITVEKAKDYNIYRFRSPFNNAYFYNTFGGNVFEDDSELPYIIVDGETYKDDKGKSMYYIEPSTLGFVLSVDGNSVYIDTEDWETETFGSVAGNLKTDAGPIEPGNETYPLGSYDEKKKVLDLGCVYLNVLNYTIMTTTAGSTTLALDPALLKPDYDRDYTWKDVPEASGLFTSQLTGESWIQAVQQSNEDPTFFRMPNLYSGAEKAHFYFHIDMETGTVTIPRGQDTGLTTFGNQVLLEGTPNRSSYNTASGTLTLGLTFYLADEDGKNVADLQEVTETFLWGQNSEFDQLKKGTPITDYVGYWLATMTNDANGGETLATITQVDETTLAVKGLSLMSDYDDTMYLSYDKETGWVSFGFQQVAGLEGYDIYVAPFDSAEGMLSTADGFIGGISQTGSLLFLNDTANEGTFDSMVYLVYDGTGFGMMSGYWNTLEWAPYSASTSAVPASFDQVTFGNFQKVEQGFVPRRTYKTELNIQPKPRTNRANGTNSVTFDANLLGGMDTTFSLAR